jgi:hypothetical protein
VGNVLLLQPVESPGFSLAKRMTALMVATIYLLKGLSTTASCDSSASASSPRWRRRVRRQWRSWLR